MSKTIDELKNLIAACEDEMMTMGEFQALAFRILMEDDIKLLKEGWGSAVSSTCCCRYPHNLKDTYVRADLIVTPHGYSVEPKGSWWRQLWRIVHKPKLISIRGGC